MNFGQTCHAGTRIYVHEDVYDEFVAAYTKRMGSLKVGDNFDENVDQGPQNSKTQFEKILGYIESGKEEGATISLGGEVAEVENGEGRGYYIQPTIFTDMKPQMKIMCEESFGPVVCIVGSVQKKKFFEKPIIRPTVFPRPFTPKTTSAFFASRMD